MNEKSSPEVVELGVKPPSWPENPDLRSAVEWFTSFMSEAEWRERRRAVLNRFINAANGSLAMDLSGEGRFFSRDDQFGWYLFLAQAKLDHPTIYDFNFGARVVPVFEAIGRNLLFLKDIEGIQHRVTRLVGVERGQPNGCLYELLVAAAYRARGGLVRFLPEQPGVAKRHDLDVQLNGINFAVECKRMEAGEYTDQERERARCLWLPTARRLHANDVSVLAKVAFSVALEQIPDDYLAKHATYWQAKRILAPHEWQDDYATGSIGLLNMKPLQDVLEDHDVAITGPRLAQLLTGKHRRNAKNIKTITVEMGENPVYVSQCHQAVVLDWESHSEDAIAKKARDVRRRLADAVKQLPKDRPGVVHIGLETVDGDDVEKVRFDRIKATLASFDSGEKPLTHVYINWFEAEVPPEASEVFDETCHWHSFVETPPRPLENGFVVLPLDTREREGMHWDGKDIPDQPTKF